MSVVNHHNLTGYTPLMMASSLGHLEMAKILIKSRARIDFSNFSDYSLLHLPPEQLNLSSRDVLLKQHDLIQGSALDIAVIKGNVEMASLLLQDGAKVHNVFYLIRSITLLLARANAEKNVDQLQNMVATTTTTKFNGDSAESADLWEKFSVIIRLLATHHSDFIERVQCTKPSCLYMACAFGVLELASLLLELGTDVSDLYRTDDSGSTYWLSLVTIIQWRIQGRGQGGLGPPPPPPPHRTHKNSLGLCSVAPACIGCSDMRKSYKKDGLEVDML